MNTRIVILFVFVLICRTNGTAQHSLVDTATILRIYREGEAIENSFPDSAMELYDKAFNSSKLLKFERGVFLYYRNALYLNSTLGAFRKADSIRIEFLELASKSDNDYYKAIANEGAGTFFARQDINDRAITHYVRAAALFDKLKDSTNLNLTYRNASIVFLALDQPENAVYYINQAFQLRPSFSDTFSLIQGLSILGESYGKLNDSLQEIYSLQKMVSLATSFQNEYLRVKSFAKYGEYLYAKNKPDSSRYYLEQAKRVAQKNRFVLEYFHILVDLLELSNHQKMPTVDIVSGIETVLARNSDQLPLNSKRYYYSVLYKVLKDQGKFKEALSTREAWEIINDSIKNRLSISKLAYFDKQLKQTESRNILLEKENKINRQRSIITILILGIVSLSLLILVFGISQRKKNQLRDQKIESMKKEQRFIALSSSLEAQVKERARISKEIHDELGTSLTSISLLTEVLKKRLSVEDYPEVMKISERSAEMVDKMNEIVWAMSTTNDNLQSLLAYIRKFANSFLQEAGIEFEYLEEGIEDGKPIDGYSRRNIYLVIKEALNNAVKHSGASKVVLHVRLSDKLVISVKDNGKGFDENAQPAFRNGIINMKKRMEELRGVFSVIRDNGTRIDLSYTLKGERETKS